MKLRTISLLAFLGAAGFAMVISVNTDRSRISNAADIPELAIQLDGEFGDWPAGSNALADPFYIYLKLQFPEVIGLQTSTVATSVLIDLDGNDATGATLSDAAGNEIMRGVELELMFAPVANRNRDGVGGGAALRVYDGTGQATELPHQALGFASLPTYASDTFELRIPRYLLNDMDVAQQLRASLPLRARIVRLNADELSEWLSDDMVLATRLPAPGVAPLVDVDLPSKPVDGLRLFSVNVEWAAPVDDPDAFVRILKAVKPDIVMLQEWDKPSFVMPEGEAPIQYEASFVADWFTTHMGDGSQWQASRNEELGVIIVSALPMSSFGNNAAAYSLSDGPERLVGNTVRFNAALVETHLGPVAIGNIHLRCCGALASREDHLRMAESLAVNAAFRRAMTQSGAIMGIIAGDYNLVGSMMPKQIVALGADVDGSDLAVAPSYSLRGDSNITWRDARSGFSPSRLDYILYTNSSAEQVNSFALDTEVMTDAALDRNGLQRQDGRFSDHLPLVLDLRVQN